MKRMSALALGVLALVPAAARAQNDTAATAAHLATNGPSIRQFFSAASPARWYRYAVTSGQSYCVETATASVENQPVDTVVDVFEDDGTTAIGSNDDAVGQPDAAGGSRFCYTAVADGFNTVRVAPAGAAPATDTQFQVRVAGNMLYSPWWLTSSRFDALISLRNTTSAPVRLRVTARDPAGAVVGTPRTVTLAPNGGAPLTIKAVLGVQSGTGTVDITSDAAPGAVVGNITTRASDVSFDSPFVLRQQPRW
jgi:hypothetical protein